MNSTLKVPALLLFLSFWISSCEKDPALEPKPVPEVLKGGLGGPYFYTVFPKYFNTGIVCNISMRYAANRFPSDSVFSENAETKVEQGLEPFIRYNDLKIGTYYIFAQNQEYIGDTVLNFREGMPYKAEVILRMRKK